MSKSLVKRLVKNEINFLLEGNALTEALLDKLEKVSQTLESNRNHLKSVEKTAAVSNASYHKLVSFIQKMQMFKDVDIDWETWPKDSLQCVHVDLQRANEQLREECRTQAQIIKDWQNFCSKLAKILNCMSLDEDVLAAVQKLKKSTKRKPTV